MKKFVINLKRRPDRLKQFQERCPYTDVEVVYGFDGKNPNDESKNNQRIFKLLPKTISPGARGCWISHLNIWKKIISQNLPMAMIFEDDALFNENFNLESFDLPTNGIIYFGGRFTKDFMVPEPYSLKINENINKSNPLKWDGKLHDRTTHGYIITNVVAKLLIETFNNNQNQTHVDHFIIQTLKTFEIPIYNTIPLMCYSPRYGDSDIQLKQFN